MELDFRFVRAGNVRERDLGRVAGQQLGLRLPERKRLVATGLHLADEEDPECHEHEIGEDLDDRAQRLTGLLRLKLHIMGS